MSDDEFYDSNRKIIVVAILSLSFLAVVAALLHLYRRFIAGRRNRRRANLSAVSAADPVKAGLDPSAIAALPAFTFNSESTGEDDRTGAVECAVCLSFLEDGDVARSLRNCNHTFHATCVDEWLRSNSTCPICRLELELEPEPEPEPRREPEP